MTFPQQLRKAGYRTGLFGKWHLKSKPTGFDEWTVYPGQGHYYNPDYLSPEGKKRITGYCVDTTTDLALGFLERQKAKQKPFLLMCHFKAPHGTWIPGPNYMKLYNDRKVPEPDNLFDDYRNRASPASRHEMGIDQHMPLGYRLFVPHTECTDWGRMTKEQRITFAAAFEPENQEFEQAGLTGRELVRWKYQRYIKNYLRCVKAVDDSVGRILAFLEANGLDGNTIVVYSSDQGRFLGDHGWHDKRWMYEEAFRMPLVMRWPGVISPGTKIDNLTQNIDFAPTFLDACGIPIPAEIQGKSLLSLLRNPQAKWRTSLYYHYHEFRGHNVPRHYGIRTDRYKLIHYYTTDEWELMDLEKDPREMRSVYSEPGYQSIREQLAQELKDLRSFYADTESDHE